MMESLFYIFVGIEIILILLIVADEEEKYVTPRQMMWPILSFVVCMFLAVGVSNLERTYVVYNGSSVVEHTVTIYNGSPFILFFAALGLLSSLILIYRTMDVLAYRKKLKEEAG